jgi:hypothetical protein
MAISPDVNRPGNEADHSPPSKTEVNDGAIPPVPSTSSLSDAELNTHMDKVTFFNFTLKNMD